MKVTLNSPFCGFCKMLTTAKWYRSVRASVASSPEDVSPFSFSLVLLFFFFAEAPVLGFSSLPSAMEGSEEMPSKKGDRDNDSNEFLKKICVGEHKKREER